MHLKQYQTAQHDLNMTYSLGGQLKWVFWEKGCIYSQLQAQRLAFDNFRLAFVSGIPSACKEGQQFG